MVKEKGSFPRTLDSSVLFHHGQVGLHNLEFKHTEYITSIFIDALSQNTGIITDSWLNRIGAWQYRNGFTQSPFKLQTHDLEHTRNRNLAIYNLRLLKSLDITISFPDDHHIFYDILLPCSTLRECAIESLSNPHGHAAYDLNLSRLTSSNIFYVDQLARCSALPAESINKP